MNGETHPLTAHEPRTVGTVLRLPVRYVHDAASDTWSYSIEIPPVTGRGCGCREVAERSAIAALRRQLAACARPQSASEQIGDVSAVLVPVGDGLPPVRPTQDEGSCEPTAPQAAAADAASTRTAFGFHPHSLRVPVCDDITGRGAEHVTLTGTAGVVILDPATGEVVGECAGPRPDGSCPALTEGALLPCRGARIRGRIRGSTRRFQFDVAPAAAECPLRQLVKSEAERAREAFLGSAKEY